MEWKITGEVWNERPIVEVVVRYQSKQGVPPKHGGSAPEQSVRVLIDTGSTHSALNAKIIKSLNLEFLQNSTQTGFAVKDRPVKCYFGAVVIGTNPELEINGIIFSEEDLPDTFDGILGMDFLKYGTWQFNPDGTFSGIIQTPDD